MSRRKSETLLFCPGGSKAGGAVREEKRREVKPRPRSGARQRRLSVPSLVVEQSSGQSLNTLTLGGY